MEGEIILTYQTDSDDENVENDLHIDPQRKRGIALLWSFVQLHADLQSGFTSMNSSNVPQVTRLKGRNNRGKTAAYYLYCAKKSFGCSKQWRLLTAFDSLLVTEEETSKDHHDHDKFLRNVGKGMSAEEVEIVVEAFKLHIKKPKSVLDYFRDIALRDPTTGAFIFHLIMTLIILN